MLTRWDPFSDMVSLREAMGRLLNESFVRPGPQWTGTAVTSPFPFDLYESGDGVFVRVAIPGADESSIELTVNQGVLTVKGHRNFYSGDQEKQYTWHARNLVEGAFQFAVALPTMVSAEAAEAAYDGGILTISLPKAETVKPKRIAVKGARTQEAIAAGSQ